MAPRPVIEGIVDIVRDEFDDEVRGAPLMEGKPPSWGCCMVASLVLQDYLGGQLIRTTLNGNYHVFLEMDDGKVVDATLDQFGFVLDQSDAYDAVSRAEVLTYKPGIADRYRLLKERVDGKL